MGRAKFFVVRKGSASTGEVLDPQRYSVFLAFVLCIVKMGVVVMCVVKEIW